MSIMLIVKIVWQNWKIWSIRNQEMLLHPLEQFGIIFK